VRPAAKITVQADMRSRRPLMIETWEYHLNIARRAASEAGDAIRSQFGCRSITSYKGIHDVQLEADLLAQRIIVSKLTQESPECGIVAEEGSYKKWPDDELAWAVDPLDGSNNFAYGIAHCAIAISLFRGDSVVLALVWDPVTEREFFATDDQPMTRRVTGDIGLERATVSLVTNYSQDNHVWGSSFSDWLGARCKRVTTLWAPALDLALVADGSLDAMVCHEADLLDVCGGAYLVKSSGGSILSHDGRRIEIRRSMHGLPVSFVAARTTRLAQELIENLDRFQRGRG
jgi:myo-inositol-1(or 4)-monophosphatase